MIPQACLEMSRDKQEEIHLGEVDSVGVRDLEAFQDSKGSMISLDRVDKLDKGSHSATFSKSLRNSLEANSNHEVEEEVVVNKLKEKTSSL
jgi:hypothetical protein